jgi:molybdenum cofactor cytidylyltransferase
VWSRRFFPDLSALTGDVGARGLIASYPEAVVEIAMADDAALIDIDTPDALDAVRAAMEQA